MERWPTSQQIDADPTKGDGKVLSIGVEEEFLLAAPDGSVAPVAREVAQFAGAPDAVKPEFMAYQLETATGVCDTTDQLRGELALLRRTAADSAGRLGAHLLATGMPPFRSPAVEQLSPDIRYSHLATFPNAIAAGGACACQVHVGVADRDLRVQVLARLRPWLPTLLALTANSAIFDGEDTGWSSYRYRALRHWPTFRLPGVWSDGEMYDRVVNALIASGAALSPRSVYFLARLSAQYPTIEVRVADTCLNVEDSVLLAAVTRGLVAALIDDIRYRRRALPATTPRVEASLLATAHHGVAGRGTTPGARQRAFESLCLRLLDKIGPQLDRFGDLDEVVGGLRRVAETGTGAEQQRLMWSRATGREDFVRALADAARAPVPAA